jgi:hypothetical protein
MNRVRWTLVFHIKGETVHLRAAQKHGYRSRVWEGHCWSAKDYAMDVIVMDAMASMYKSKTMLPYNAQIVELHHLQDEEVNIVTAEVCLVECATPPQLLVSPI